MGRLQQDKAKASGASHSFGATLSPQLAQNGVNVELDGVIADTQTGCNAFVGQSFSQEPQNFHLSGGEALHQWCLGLFPHG